MDKLSMKEYERVSILSWEGKETTATGLNECESRHLEAPAVNMDFIALVHTTVYGWPRLFSYAYFA